MVILTSEFAGTVRTVLCTHVPWVFLARYETQSGCGPKPSDATVCNVRAATGPRLAALTGGGRMIRYETM